MSEPVEPLTARPVVTEVPTVRTARAPLFRHLVLFGLTFYTMTLAGASASPRAAQLSAWDPGFLVLGLPYALCLMAILGVHEMGHYVACRIYGVDASLPYFLPNILPFFGTFGAFIRIRAPIPNRRALFDIGVAGPLAGFAVVIPVAIYGAAVAEFIPLDSAGMELGDPLLMSWATAWLTDVPEGQVALLSGPLMAAWVGCLATAINLFPVGQLDGGHICYALSARIHRSASIVLVAAFVLLGMLLYPGWLVFALLMVAFGPRHPPVTDPEPGIGVVRAALALLSLIILIICFVPRPIEFSSM